MNGKMPAGGFTKQLQPDAGQRARDVARRLDVLLADIRRQEAEAARKVAAK